MCDIRIEINFSKGNFRAFKVDLALIYLFSSPVPRNVPRLKTLPPAPEVYFSNSNPLKLTMQFISDSLFSYVNLEREEKKLKKENKTNKCC